MRIIPLSKELLRESVLFYLLEQSRTISKEAVLFFIEEKREAFNVKMDEMDREWTWWTGKEKKSRNLMST